MFSTNFMPMKLLCRFRAFDSGYYPCLRLYTGNPESKCSVELEKAGSFVAYLMVICFKVVMVVRAGYCFSAKMRLCGESLVQSAYSKA